MTAMVEQPFKMASGLSLPAVKRSKPPKNITVENPLLNIRPIIRIKWTITGIRSAYVCGRFIRKRVFRFVKFTTELRLHYFVISMGIHSKMSTLIWISMLCHELSGIAVYFHDAINICFC